MKAKFKREFKNKLELIAFVKHQLNIELNYEPNLLNKKRNLLYIEIPDSSTGAGRVLSLLCANGVKYEKHRNNYHWIYLK